MQQAPNALYSAPCGELLRLPWCCRGTHASSGLLKFSLQDVAKTYMLKARQGTRHCEAQEGLLAYQGCRQEWRGR